MAKLRKYLLDLFYEYNVRCDETIEELVDDVEEILENFLADDWSIDDCK